MKPPPEIASADLAADEPPPLLGSWRRLYLAVLLYLVAIIVVFWLFTRTFNQ